MHVRSTLAAAAALFLFPDEGQWLPTQVREFDWSALGKRGMQLTKDEFWHPERGGVLSATVQINGCTASFVSQDGLLVTNHHCGFDAIGELSTVEHNWLRDGFYAADRAGELPAPGMVAFVLKRIEDVTAAVHAAQAKAKTNLERWDATQRQIATLVREGQKQEPGTICSVASFLEGKEYHLYYRTRLTDVRLVYAPPRAIGEFGGEVDNWEWPRHTGDFSFFRAYAAPDGSPRDHHADNVPYRPAHSLRVALGGVAPGDLALIMGYPGQTQRYKSSRAIATQQSYVFPVRDTLLTAVIDVLERAASSSEAKGIELASRIKTLANVQKNARGMIFGLQRNGVVERKLREEDELRAWIAGTKERSERFGDIVDQVLAIDEAEAAMVERDTAIGFASALLDDVPLVATLVDACAAMADASDGKLPAGVRKAIGSDLATDLDLVQRPILAILLQHWQQLPAGQRIADIPGVDEGAPPMQVEDLVARSQMQDGKARTALFADGAKAVAASNDPLVALARGIAAERRAHMTRQRERRGQQLLTGRQWIEAQEAFRGKSFYPDANSTLRVAIATVKGYSPRDGVTYAPQTTVAGLLDKENGKEPFASPKQLLAAAPSRRQSRWVDPRIGDVPVCFLCDGDTTGGNSGSPVVNGKGELIGLNFDRVFEAVAGDFGWNAERSRNVCCDIRYVLWVMEAVLPAPSLLRELGA